MNAPESNVMQEQYAALTRGAGLCDLTGRTRIELTGGDRQKFLHNFCTGDVLRLVPGTGCEAFVTSVQGKTLAHGHVFCQGQRLIFDTVPDQASTLLAHFEKYHITEDVAFRDLTAEDGALLAAGSGAGALLGKVAGIEPPAETGGNVSGEIAGVAVDVARLPLAGEGSLEITCTRAELPAVRDALLGAGAVTCGSEALEVVRLENSYPLFGRDITPANLPQEVDRNEQAISFTKGCYLGQETVARIDALGHVNRRLVGVRFDGTDVPSSGEELTAESDSDQSVGQVTSAVFSPRLDAPLALAYVRSKHAEPGSRLRWRGGDAEVVSLPLA